MRRDLGDLTSQMTMIIARWLERHKRIDINPSGRLEMRLNSESATAQLVSIWRSRGTTDASYKSVLGTNQSTRKHTKPMGSSMGSGRRRNFGRSDIQMSVTFTWKIIMAVSSLLSIRMKNGMKTA
jgi:hypothetical protein